MEQRSGSGEVIDEEELLVDLAVASNYGYKTFNQTYAGFPTLVMNTPLHQTYQASQSWRILFQIDEHLSREEAADDSGKCLRSMAELDEPGDMAETDKRTKLRTRPLAKVKDLEAVAREPYNNATLRLRHPGRRIAWWRRWAIMLRSIGCTRYGFREDVDRDSGRSAGRRWNDYHGLARGGASRKHA